MDDLLTTRQLQGLLQVDRITIYRMLSDGRLRGFKVGGQWRFSRQDIEAWLQAQQSSQDVAEAVPSGGEMAVPSPQALPLNCVLAIQAVYAEALDIGAVTTELDGMPLAEISHSCEFCNLILSTAEGLRGCASAWSSVEDGQPHRCHAGLLCVTAPVRVGNQWVATAVGCQFTIPLPEDAAATWHANLPALAADLGLDERDLRAAASTVRVLPEDHLPRVALLLRRVADTFSEIGQERLDLLSRLQHIAEMSKI